MITISQLSRLFHISDQTIRMYERYGILRLSRSHRNNYRLFDLRAFTALIKARILQSLGFSMKDIGRLANGLSYAELDSLFREHDRQLQYEMRLLEGKRRATLRLAENVREIAAKDRTCEEVTSEAYYLFPVLDGDHIVLPEEKDFLRSWNKHSFIRQDINLLSPDGKSQTLIFYGVTAHDALEYRIDTSGALFIPERRCIRAFFTRPADYTADYSRDLAFAFDEIRRRGEQVAGPLLLFLPLAAGIETGTHYYHALIPIRP